MLLEKFKLFIQEQNLLPPNTKILVAVSGGVDSVVLCELCKNSGIDFAIAHCNFKLRGADSERDETFVQQLAEKYKVPFFATQFDTNSIAQQQKKSIEETARDLRYQWFNEIIKTETDLKIKYIATAHHTDDNVETALMNFCRGTGIKGLRGILPKQNNIIRPLLFAYKNEIIVFATKNNIVFVQDYTNAENDFTRNYFRNELLPSIQKVYPMAAKNITQNINRMVGVEQLYNQAIDLHKKKLLVIKGNEIHIPILKLLQAKPLSTIVYEVIKDYSFTAHQIEEVISLLKSESGKYIQSPTHRIINNRKWLIISPNKTIDAQNILIEQTDQQIHFAEGEIILKKSPISNQPLPTNHLIATVDEKNIEFPLLLRKWKQGDYFYPLGMQKKKKLSKFFIDQKLSLIDKEKIWVIESNKKIIWVLGMRIDDRFKITPSTKNILQFQLICPK